MNRSDFIKFLGLGLGGIALPQTLLFKTEQVKIYDNYIRGIHFYSFKKLSENIKEVDEVFLQRDAGNIHDAFAIEVYYQDSKLGFVAAYENIVLANMLDRQIKLQAKVSKINLDAYNNQLAIEVYAELVVPSNRLITMIEQETRADDSIDLYRNNFEI